MPNIPHDLGKGEHKIPFERVVYIEQSDYKEVHNVVMVGRIRNKQADRMLRIISTED